ncbi:hypothetical protein QL285_031361 [Trifolium repens]|nr:hypothetical protein QL285_031361 [Trifolium repens]
MRVFFTKDTLGFCTFRARRFGSSAACLSAAAASKVFYKHSISLILDFTIVLLIHRTIGARFAELHRLLQVLKFRSSFRLTFTELVFF